MPAGTGRTCIIGLDGATFGVLDKWVAAGDMPNLAALMARGSRSELTSTIPPATAPAWTSLTTGVGPGSHGIFDFLKWSPAGARIVESGDVAAPRIWDVAGAHSRTVGVLNVPLTFPASPVTGFMVAGMPTPRLTEAAVFPPGLFPEMKRRGLDVTEQPLPRGSSAGCLRAILRSQLRFERVTAYLLERFHPDFFICVFRETDRIQHRFWHYCSKGPEAADRRLQSLVRDFYCALDRAIGLLASHFGSDATYYVVSDHGMGPLEGLCGLNRFLADRGFIAFDRRRARQGAMKLSILRQVTRAAAQVGLLGPAMHLLARLRGPRAAEALRRDAFGFVSDAVDWEHTLAVAKSRSDYGIWVNLRGREPHGIVEPGEQYEKVRSALIEALQALRDPKSREMLVTGVWRKEEILEGLPVSEAPDVYLLLRDGAVGRGLSPTEPLFGNVSPSAGGHRLGGVLVTCGPDIKPGAEVDAHITDIAPTVLYTMGLPVPRHMEGKVLMGLVRDEFVAAHPIRKVERRGARRGAPSEGPPLAPADAAEIKYRLRDLGYL